MGEIEKVSFLFFSRFFSSTSRHLNKRKTLKTFPLSSYPGFLLISSEAYRNWTLSPIDSMPAAFQTSTWCFSFDFFLKKEEEEEEEEGGGSKVSFDGRNSLDVNDFRKKERKKKKGEKLKTPFYHVVPDHLDLGQVPAHLVVQLREPVSDPELEGHARTRQLVDVEGLHHSLGYVHPPGGLEAVVGYGLGLLLEQGTELVVLDALLSDGAGEGEALVEGEPGRRRRRRGVGFFVLVARG